MHWEGSTFTWLIRETKKMEEEYAELLGEIGSGLGLAEIRKSSNILLHYGLSERNIAFNSYTLPA